MTPEGLPQELEEDDASAAPDLQQGPTLVAKMAKQAAACEGWPPLRRDPGRFPEGQVLVHGRLVCERIRREATKKATAKTRYNAPLSHHYEGVLP